MKLVRITCEASGASHFDEVEVPLAAHPFGLMSGPAPADRYVFLQMAPGQDTGWHPSSARMLTVVVAGEIEVAVSGKPIQMAYLDHYRIADGRIAEAWEVRDALALQQQRSVLTRPSGTSSQ